jgi:ABC-2 type transport system ATP-binding protein
MIQTTNLTKRYGDLTAVDGIDIEVESGSIHGFIGPNGAGKTTTMKMLVGLISPTEGEVLIDGAPAGSLAAKETIGYAPQDPAFYESMTGREYLEYMGKTAGMGAQVHDRATELFSWLDLQDAAEQRVSGYSGGMKRRLSLAQAMIHEPDLLILDEPTAALDPSGRMAIIESLTDLTEEGMTVFVSSHVLAELEQFIDMVTILNDGEVVETGPIEKIQGSYGGQSFAVETADNDRLVTLLADRHWVSNVRHASDGSVTVVTDDPEEFKTQLQQLLADEGLVLESLQATGGLEDAFADAIEQTPGGGRE